MDFKFDYTCQEAFEELKQCMIEAPILCHYDATLESMIKTDVSDRVIAGILSQKHPDSKWYLVAFFLKIMTLAECNYKIHDKEMLVIVQSLQEWRLELERTHSRIQVFIDHKSLEYFMTTKELTA